MGKVYNCYANLIFSSCYGAVLIDFELYQIGICDSHLNFAGCSIIYWFFSVSMDTNAIGDIFSSEKKSYKFKGSGIGIEGRVSHIRVGPAACLGSKNDNSWNVFWNEMRREKRRKGGSKTGESDVANNSRAPMGSIQWTGGSNFEGNCYTWEFLHTCVYQKWGGNCLNFCNNQT